jgi:Tol biopolymer transport system component
MALNLPARLVRSWTEKLDRGLQQRLQRHRRSTNTRKSALWFEPVESRVMLSTTTTLVNVATDAGMADFGGNAASVSADGRFVAYQSIATNLVPNDTNIDDDIFVYDRQAGTTERVSIATEGTEGNGSSVAPMISANGRYVTFASSAKNLVAGDTNDKRDIFVHDRQTGTTERVSLASDDTQANDVSNKPSISSDGRYVAFISDASNLVADDSNASQDVFVYDRQAGEIRRVSVASDGTQGNNRSYDTKISANGQWVVFASDASNLVTGDTGPYSDVFVTNLQTNQTRRISVGLEGAEAAGSSSAPSISDDGRFIAFESNANNLVANDNFAYDVYLYDSQLDTIQRISLTPGGTSPNSASFTPAISGEGRFVTFVSAATDLVTGDTNSMNDVFVYDRQASLMRRVSTATDGTQGNNTSSDARISSDGRFIVFTSAATNLVANDNNNRLDVFVYASDLPFPTASLASTTLNVNEDAGTASLTVNLSQAALFDVTIDYSTSASTASAGSDYTGIASTLTIPAGQTSGTIQISITNDSAAELAENFLVVLSNPSNAFLGTNTLATITIAASELPTITAAVASLNVNEDVGNASVNVNLSAAVDFDVTVNYATANGSAIAGEDFTNTTSTLTIPAGQTSGTIQIPITNDAGAELAESFTLSLSNPVGSTLGSTTQTAITIALSDATLVNFSAQNKNTVTYINPQNQKVTVKLKSPGSGSVLYANSGELMDITLNDTTLTSSLTITVAKSAAISLEKLQVNGSLGKITAASTTLDGTLQVTQTLKSLQLAKASGMLDVGNPINPLKDKVTLILGQVSDLMIDSGTGIAKLTASDWQNIDDIANDSITAPWLGTLSVTGRKAKGIIPALSGVFEANVVLTGANAPKGIALGSVSIAGTVNQSLWTIQGNVGSVTAGFFIDSAIDMGRENNQNNAKYNLKSFTLKGAKNSSAAMFQRSRLYLTGTLASATLGRVDVTQNVTDPTADKQLGLTADRITKLSLLIPGQNNDKAFKLKQLDIAADLNDVKKNPSQLAALTNQFELTLL